MTYDGNCRYINTCNSFNWNAWFNSKILFFKPLPMFLQYGDKQNCLHVLYK